MAWAGRAAGPVAEPEGQLTEPQPDQHVGYGASEPQRHQPVSWPAADRGGVRDLGAQRQLRPLRLPADQQQQRVHDLRREQHVGMRQRQLRPAGRHGLRPRPLVGHVHPGQWQHRRPHLPQRSAAVHQDHQRRPGSLRVHVDHLGFHRDDEPSGRHRRRGRLRPVAQQHPRAKRDHDLGGQRGPGQWRGAADRHRDDRRAGVHRLPVRRRGDHLQPGSQRAVRHG